MAKSKFPAKIDSSVELPAVRDNILSVGSDAINGLRSAIFAIEQTLGINPQGTSGNTVAGRIGQSLDSNGNILPSALSMVNVLVGPILDNDVSDVAAVKESKLKLDFPTKVLQSEISSLQSELDEIILNLEQLNADVLAHLNPLSTGRHPATAISVSEYSSSGSSTASSDIASGSVQSLAQSIYDGHINFTESATSDNKSHSASQIFFDNADTSGIVESSDVQGAVEDIANNQFQGIVGHQDRFHADGLLGASQYRLPESSEWTRLFADDVLVSFSKNSGQESNKTLVTLDTPITLGNFDLKPFDLVLLQDSSNTESLVNGTYQIESLALSMDELDVNGFYLFGNLPVASNATSVVKIFKKIDAIYNEANLLICARQDPDLTSSKILQVNDGRSAFVKSVGINPAEITSVNRYFNLSVDGGSADIIDVYDSSSTWQTLDSIIFKINEFVSEGAKNYSAYRIDSSNGSELVISLNIPDDDAQSHYLTISRGSDDAIDSIGFSQVEGVDVYSKYGSTYTTAGIERLGLNTKFDFDNLSFSAGSNIIFSGGTGIDFLELGVKRDDLIIISGSGSDNGTYVISSVTAENIIVSTGQLPSGFSAISADGTRFRVFDNTISLKDIEFSEVSDSFGSTLCEIFLDEKNSLHSKSVFEYTAQVFSSQSLIQLVDYAGDVSGKTFSLSVVGGTDLATFSLDGGTEIDVRGDHSYFWLTSGNNNVSLKFYVKEISLVNAKITSDAAPLSMQFFGFEPVNRLRNLLIAKVPYDNFNGRVSGANYGRSFDQRQVGTISSFDIQNDAKKELSYTPISELRSNGVIYGCDILSQSSNGDGFFEFQIQRGVVYVSGKRVEVSENTVITDIDTGVYDKMYVAIDEYSNILFEPALPGCASSFVDADVCIIGTIEYDGLNAIFIDMRLFIDHLDLRLLNSITVSPQKSMGHFDSIPRAIAYAKRFSSIYPQAGVPTIHLKSGTHEIILDIDNTAFGNYDDWKTVYDIADGIGAFARACVNDLYSKTIKNGFFLDFPVNITGEGDSTILKLRSNTDYGDDLHLNRGQILIFGNGVEDDGTNYSDVNFDRFNSGKISISNLKMDNCYISFVDGNCQTDAENHNFSLKIDDVTFDNSGFTEVGVDVDICPSAAFFQRELSDDSNKKGNVSISNCRFIEANIRLSDAFRLYNIDVLHNKLYGDATDTLLVGSSVYLLLDVAIQQSGKNINIIGNQHFSNYVNTGASGDPNLVDTTDWSDRISRSLAVFGNVGIAGHVANRGTLSSNGAISTNSTVTATRYDLQSIQTRSKVFLINQDIVYSAGSSLATVTSHTFLDGETRLRVLDFSGTDCAYLPIQIEDDNDLYSVKIFGIMTAETNLPYSFDIDIVYLGNDGLWTPVSSASASGTADSDGIFSETILIPDSSPTSNPISPGSWKANSTQIVAIKITKDSDSLSSYPFMVWQYAVTLRTDRINRALGMA